MVSSSLLKYLYTSYYDVFRLFNKLFSKNLFTKGSLGIFVLLYFESDYTKYRRNGKKDFLKTS